MYAKFLLKINKGGTQNNIACDKATFVLILNECKNRWVEKGIKDKDNILIDSYQEIVKTDTFITPSDTTSEYTEFELFADFYESILVKCHAVKGDCKKILYSREAKNQNKNFLQFDEANRPDFEWEWTFHSIQGNKIRIYKDDFEITSADFEYYSVIPDIQMEGTYDVFDNYISTSIGIDVLSDQYVDQIINFAAKEFEMNYQNPQGVQIAQERINSQE